MVKRACCFVLSFALAVVACVGVLGAARLTSGGYARVIEIYDGDALKVKMDETGEVALVRFAGIDARGYDGAFSHLLNTLQGKTVYVVFDSSPQYVNNRWNYMHVYHNGESVNLKLLSLGFAVVRDDYSGRERAAFLAEEAAAKARGAGMWGARDKYKNTYPVNSGDITVGGDAGTPVTGDGININTAPISVLAERMPDVPYAVLTYVVSYRAVNPFNETGEIKFVPGFTAALYNKYRNIMRVSTNIQTAPLDELVSLGLSAASAQRVITHREAARFTNKSDLLRLELVNATLYAAIEDFIAVTNVSKITVAVPATVVGLNDATQAELIGLGLSAERAAAFISARGNYTYKTLSDLMQTTGVRLTYAEVYALADNLTVSSGSYININFASYAELAALGLTATEADALIARSGRMREYSDIPVDISRMDDRITLYTCVNTASASELDSLGISPAARNAIIQRRAQHPIGSAEELSEIMGQTAAGYNSFAVIRDFVVFI